MLRSLLALFTAITVGYFQVSLRPRLRLLGVSGGGHPIEYLNLDKCHIHPELELEACEKLVLHQPTGLLYLACSTPSGRVHWMPSLMHFNASGRSTTDYVATYNPSTSTVHRLSISGFDDARGLSLHGMDVVPSSSNPSELFVYLINHRTPDAPLDVNVVGANSSVEIFRTSVGGSVLTYVKTMESPDIATPNDLMGSPDGKSFYVTNEYGFKKAGLVRKIPLSSLLGLDWSHVTYCHIDHGCKIALDKLSHSNGIARGKDGSIYLASTGSEQLYILEEQADNTLVISDIIHPDRPIDNLAVDSEGSIWAAGFPSVYNASKHHFKNPSLPAPSSALRISLNTGQSQYFGEKWKIEKMFDDDGQVASASTSAVYDAERKLLYLHGLTAPYLTICEF